MPKVGTQFGEGPADLLGIGHTRRWNVTRTHAHDLSLFAALREQAFEASPDLREGRMFGCPALFVGRRMALCVLGDEIGMRVPAQTSEAARSAGRARHFTPYGKRPMREWIALDGGIEAIAPAADLIRAAVTFAGHNDGRDS